MNVGYGKVNGIMQGVEAVKEIRESTLTTRQLANKFNLEWNTINDVRRKKTWAKR